MNYSNQCQLTIGTVFRNFFLPSAFVPLTSLLCSFHSNLFKYYTTSYYTTPNVYVRYNCEKRKSELFKLDLKHDATFIMGSRVQRVKKRFCGPSVAFALTLVTSKLSCAGAFSRQRGRRSRQLFRSSWRLTAGSSPSVRDFRKIADYPGIYADR